MGKKRKERCFTIWSPREGCWLMYTAKTAKHAVALHLKRLFPNKIVKNLLVTVDTGRCQLNYFANDGKITYLHKDNEIEESPESFHPKKTFLKAHLPTAYGVTRDNVQLTAGNTFMCIGLNRYERTEVEKLRDFCNDVLTYWDKLKEAGR